MREHQELTQQMEDSLNNLEVCTCAIVHYHVTISLRNHILTGYLMATNIEQRANRNEDIIL